MNNLKTRLLLLGLTLLNTLMLYPHNDLVVREQSPSSVIGTIKAHPIATGVAVAAVSATAITWYCRSRCKKRPRSKTLPQRETQRALVRSATERRLASQGRQEDARKQFTQEEDERGQDLQDLNNPRFPIDERRIATAIVHGDTKQVVKWIQSSHSSDILRKSVLKWATLHNPALIPYMSSAYSQELICSLCGKKTADQNQMAQWCFRKCSKQFICSKCHDGKKHYNTVGQCSECTLESSECKTISMRIMGRDEHQ